MYLYIYIYIYKKSFVPFALEAPKLNVWHYSFLTNRLNIISGSQIFYLVDEAEHKGKGANTVTSLLHHQFLYHGYGEDNVHFHMDNCSGQNKNNTVIWYV